MHTPPQPTFGPLRIGRRLMVIPSGLELDLDPDLLPIRLDPGSAFGTGEHPTTRLCLLALERHLKTGSSVLDLGTGTGILAIAAARLGSGPVLGLDIDPEAVKIARANVFANGLSERVRVEHGSLAQSLEGHWGPPQAQMIIANILLGVIDEFFDHGLTQALPPGGWLILSGILHSQTPMIRARLQWHQLELLAQEQIEEWVCIIARQAQ